MDGLTVNILGPLEVSLGDRPVSLAMNRMATILAVLAAFVGTTVSTETIGEHVWGERPPANLRRSVQTWVARLRAVVGANAIVSMPAGYLLAIAPERVDARRFTDLLDAAANAADPRVERAMLDEALRLWRGKPFDGVASPRLEQVQAVRLTERYLTALERAADLDVETGTRSDVIGRLRAETIRQPLRESLWARLLVSLALSDRHAEALATYDTIRRRLADELGVDPGPELQRVHGELLAHAGSVAQPALRPRQLPADVEPFVGRSDAMNAMDELLLTADSTGGGGVVVVVHGKGGAGKTSLAVHWAHSRHERFPGGQLFVDLRGFSADPPLEPLAALATLLVGLGVPGDAIPADLDARSALLRTMLTDRQVLVVLDNARDAGQVRPLLPGASGRAIITSRHELGGLSAREGARHLSADQFGRAEAVALLTSRLRRHGLAVAEPTKDKLATLCGHTPLALVVAAEHLAQRPLESAGELIHALEDERTRLDRLASGNDPAASVRSVFSWSYTALDPESARVFRQLAFQLCTDFSPELAAAVVGLPRAETRQILDRLMRAHLLQRSPGNRFQFHDLIRIYAAERAEQEEREEDLLTQDIRCLDWYLHTLHNAANVLQPNSPRTRAAYFGASTAPPLTFGDRSSALVWCQTEQRNLEVVTRRSHTAGRHEHTWRMAWQLGRYLMMSGECVTVQVELSELGFASATKVSDEAGYLAANYLGTAYDRARRYDEAIRCFTDALASCRTKNDHGTECVVLMNLGVTLHHRGDVELARLRFEESLAAARRWDDAPAQTSLMSPNVAAVLLNLSNTLNALGQYTDGIARAEEALGVARETGDRMTEGMSLGSLGEAFAGLGDYPQAEECCAQAAALLREPGAEHSLVDVLLTTARVMAATGRWDAARAARDEGLDVLGTTEDHRAEDLRAVLGPEGPDRP